MQVLGSVAHSAVDFAPLVAMFGDGLTLVRDGNRVQWSLKGRSAIVELRDGGLLDATFVERPMIESVSARSAAAVYRRGEGIGYRLAPDGCSRIVADIVAFFAGAREPHFSFAGIRGGDSASP